MHLSNSGEHVRGGCGNATVVALGIMLLFTACGPKTPENKQGGPAAPPSTPAESVTPATPAAPVVPAKWACKTDDDCMNSCSQGAVNREWYRTADVRECEDGCENQLSESPRCIDGGCVAFKHDPSDERKVTRDDFCTRRKTR